MTAIAYVALGSNLGDRPAQMQRALTALGESPGVKVCKVSSFLETDPVGGPAGQGKYLNAVTQVETSLSPEELLRLLLQIEQQQGRVRGERFGPRTIDLDLLLHGNHTCETRDLTLPHPRMHEREFVLRPLAEIAPDLTHPELGRTVRELLADLPAPRSPSVPGKELSGKRALVTGSTSGIGRAIALELASAGADVLIHGRRSRESAEQVAREVERCGVRGGIVQADLAQSDRLTELVETAWEVWSGLDVWINNAGADTLTGEAAHWPFEKKLAALWEVDVRATILLSREAGARMKSAGGGVILNMGWDQADTGMEGDSGQLFGATKSAVMAFTKSLSLSLAPEVRVNCLAPGWIRTAWGEKASQVWQERVLRETPLQRWGLPEDVARQARWLVSPSASFITGQVIRVNGGAIR